LHKLNSSQNGNVLQEEVPVVGRTGSTPVAGFSEEEKEQKMSTELKEQRVSECGVNLSLTSFEDGAILMCLSNPRMSHNHHFTAEEFVVFKSEVNSI
jgi:hypothetical protein